MSNVICCKCGEPWDSTGGLHHTHSDLDIASYWLLVYGWGCPSCEENLSFAPGGPDDVISTNTRHSRWARSVELLSEGQDEFMFATFDRKPMQLSYYAANYCSVVLAGQQRIRSFAVLNEIVHGASGMNAFVVTRDNIDDVVFLTAGTKVQARPPLMLYPEAVVAAFRNYGKNQSQQGFVRWAREEKLDLVVPAPVFWDILRDKELV